MATEPIQRRYDRNGGHLSDHEIPDDRYIVGGAVVLMDDEGEFSVRFVREQPIADRRSSPLPNDEVLVELADTIAMAWNLASLTTTEEEER